MLSRYRSRPAHSEQRLLILQTLLLLLPELGQAVIVPIEIDKLVITLHASLADLLADIMQLLAGDDDSRVDEVQLGRKRL
jgi:hypothetical protein